MLNIIINSDAKEENQATLSIQRCTPAVKLCFERKHVEASDLGFVYLVFESCRQVIVDWSNAGLRPQESSNQASIC